MKALINPQQNNLVCDVQQQEFQVAEPLYWVDCDNDITVGNYTYDNGVFVPYIAPAPTAEENKAKASELLYATDWTTIADVADPALSNPYLMNQADFFAYRSALRQIAVYPTDGYITFPTKPQEQWSS
jgi:hypothetical protein